METESSTQGVVPLGSDTPNQVRGCWILLFGIVELLIGLGAGALVVLMMILFLFAERLPEISLPIAGSRILPMLALVYGGIALFFLVVGAGTLARRRWARILMLIASSLWLGVGALGMFSFVLMFPALKRSLETRAPPAPGQDMVMWIVLIVLCGLYLLLPGFFLLFYTRGSVKAAFDKAGEREDPSLRRPLPVMMLCVWLLAGAAGTLLSSLFGIQFLFGVALTGLGALGLNLSLTGIQAFLARGLYRLQPRAWWLTLGFYLLMAISGEVTLQRVSLQEILGRIGYGALQREGMDKMFSWIQAHRLLTVGATNLLLFSLLLYTKRYFQPLPPTPDAPPNGPPQGRPSLPPA
jgi:hypothetical protein